MTTPKVGAGRSRLLPLLALPLPVIALVGVVGNTAGTTAETRSGSTGAPGAVAISGFAFEPPDLRIRAGTKVVWTNDDSALHSVADEGGAFTESDDLAEGATFSFVYTEPGTYPYFCGFHNYMTGTVVVSG